MQNIVSSDGVKIAVTDAEAQAASSQGGDVDVDTFSETLNEIPSPETFGNLRILPADFEKDDDTNFHMDFIVATSNSRAENYSIALADRHKSKVFIKLWVRPTYYIMNNWRDCPFVLK